MRSEHTTFIGRNHVFDIDVGIFSSVFLKQLKSLLYQLTHVVIFFLTIVYFISNVHYR